MAEDKRKLIILILSLLHVANGARILGVFPYPSHSHQIVFRALNIELLKRGHELVVFTTHPVKDPKLKNLTEIDMQFLTNEQRRLVDLRKVAKEGIWSFLAASYKSNSVLADKVLSHPDMQRLISPNSTEKFDLVFVEYLCFDSLYALSVHFNAPMIGISSLPLLPVHHYMFGNPFAAAYSPTVLTGLTDDMNLWRRILNVYYTVRQIYEYEYISQPMQEAVLRRHFGANMPSVYELTGNASLLFVNERLFFNYPRPNLPSIVQIGGYRARRSKKSLPQDLKKILDDTDPGFIYFSLGSSVKSAELPIEIQNVLLAAFAELPYTVLWKFESEELTNRSHNVLIQKWFPQDRILAHPKIMLFMYQGGLQSTEEVVDSAVPVIGFPIYSDQAFNLNRLKSYGVGQVMDLKKLTKDMLKDTILEVISNPRYKENAVKLREFFNDMPYDPMDQAVWWTEYVIRHKGAPHLRNKSRHMMLHQTYLLDVLAIFLITCAILFYCSFIVLRHIFKRSIRSIQRLSLPIKLQLKKQE